MRRSWLVLASAALVGLATVASVAAAAPTHGGPRYAGYFAISCGFSHRNTDDAIVFPRQTGASHDHTYFGNTATNAFSTTATLRGGATTCRLAADTAAYWVPTLLSGGQPVEPVGATVYYIRRTFEQVQPFPAGLQIVAGDARATSAQSLRVTLWSCGGRSVSSTVPDCSDTRRGLRLQVGFPNCWNGTALDSADHKSHMAYSSEGVCPSTHPVEVPALTIVVRYPVTGGANTVLSSGGQFSGHGDFVNAWDQATLAKLVDRYLNGLGRRGRH